MFYPPPKRLPVPAGDLVPVRYGQRAFSLLEMLAVITIVAALASLVTWQSQLHRNDAEVTTAQSTLRAIADAFTGSETGPGYLADMRYVPGFHVEDLRIHHLLLQGDQPAFDPATRRGWHGPYIRHGRITQSANGDLEISDPWGHPIVLQIPPGPAGLRYARLVSAGPDGLLTTPPDDPMAGRDGALSARGDDLVQFLNRADIDETVEP